MSEIKDFLKMMFMPKAHEQDLKREKQENLKKLKDTIKSNMKPVSAKAVGIAWKRAHRPTGYYVGTTAVTKFDNKLFYAYVVAASLSDFDQDQTVRLLIPATKDLPLSYWNELADHVMKISNL